MNYEPVFRPSEYQKAYEKYIYLKIKMIGELYYKKYKRDKNV